MVWRIIKYFIPCIAIYLLSLEEKTVVDAQNYLLNYSWHIQSFMMAKPYDNLPLLETIRYCRCPRIYIPVCANNNHSFTNICKMNCLNTRLHLWNTNRQLNVSHRGLCWSYFDPFDY
ncbi:hypothetical protein PYW08_010079 [Mythimna loreyi]|uniref:Uncharacterized protein n=1 Tax=Mythimna loreyi TaxID=667449 RepID=A0ACC2Q648_9NEOP|nr:hypothetical protein PYW08_010079 [Mythimna loreyi]